MTLEDLAIRMRQNGYLHLKQAVSSHLVGDARRLINHSIGTKGISLDDLPVFRMDTFCPEIQSSNEILGLLHDSGILNVAEDLVGKDSFDTVTNAQIALRFPHETNAAAVPHIDGLYTAPFRAVSSRGPMRPVPVADPHEPIKIRTFTALVGVFLNSLPEHNGGNLVVWPGSHNRLEEFYQAQGVEALYDGMPDIDLGDSRQLTVEAGDAVICHYQLAHGIAPNLSPDIRYAVYFRLYRKGHMERLWSSMVDIWQEWEGVSR